MCDTCKWNWRENFEHLRLRNFLIVFSPFTWRTFPIFFRPSTRETVTFFLGPSVEELAPYFLLFQVPSDEELSLVSLLSAPPLEKASFPGPSVRSLLIESLELRNPPFFSDPYGWGIFTSSPIRTVEEYSLCFQSTDGQKIILNKNFVHKFLFQIIFCPSLFQSLGLRSIPFFSNSYSWGIFPDFSSSPLSLLGQLFLPLQPFQ